MSILTVRNSKTSQRVRYALEIGFRVEDDGSVTTPRGKTVKTRERAGYLCLTVGPPENRGRIYVHHLAALQWIGEEAFTVGLQIRHLDGNAKNNTRGNLTVGTPSQNMMDRPEEARKKHAKHAAAHLRAFTDERLKELFQDRAEGMTYRQLMSKYDCAIGTLSGIFSGKYYRDKELTE